MKHWWFVVVLVLALGICCPGYAAEGGSVTEDPAFWEAVDQFATLQALGTWEGITVYLEELHLDSTNYFPADSTATLHASWLSFGGEEEHLPQLRLLTETISDWQRGFIPVNAMAGTTDPELLNPRIMDAYMMLEESSLDFTTGEFSIVMYVLDRDASYNADTYVEHFDLRAVSSGDADTGTGNSMTPEDRASLYQAICTCRDAVAYKEQIMRYSDFSEEELDAWMRANVVSIFAKEEGLQVIFDVEQSMPTDFLLAWDEVPAATRQYYDGDQ